MHPDRIPDLLIVILSLHSISAVLSLIFAIRDGFEASALARWTLIGFITGPIGVVSRARLNKHVGYAQILLDMFLSLGLEFFATEIMPRLLRF